MKKLKIKTIVSRFLNAIIQRIIEISTKYNAWQWIILAVVAAVFLAVANHLCTNQGFPGGWGLQWNITAQNGHFGIGCMN
ncbi:MAG: hypothetical protein FWG67_08985 [Defluviitaleaceae bacterium]|nr:hypothetical protein [Defluviitaleaceae bacterium]